MKRVKSYLADPKFNLDDLMGISSAGAGLFKWVAAMVNYYNVAKTVEPKRKKVGVVYSLYWHFTNILRSIIVGLLLFILVQLTMFWMHPLRVL